MCDPGLSSGSILDLLFERQDPVLININNKDYDCEETLSSLNRPKPKLEEVWNRDTDDLLQSVLRDALPNMDGESYWSTAALDSSMDFDLLSAPDTVDISAPLDSGASDSGVSLVEQQLSPMTVCGEDNLLSPLSDTLTDPTLSGGDSDSDICQNVGEISSVDAEYNLTQIANCIPPPLEEISQVMNIPPPLEEVSQSGSNVPRLEKVSQSEKTIPMITVLQQNHNPRSVLLPVNLKDLSNIKTIRIISTGNGTKPVPGRTVVIRDFYNGSNVGSLQNTSRPATCTVTPAKRPLSSASEEDEDDEEDGEPKKLKLTDEEKRLLKKEGITLPSHYPLTRDEEQELKRIRRKIRNKVSAQDSRKRKKEYTDGLEKRVKKCTEENAALMKHIKQLESENKLLTSQMKKLHSLMGRGGSSSNRACLIVLLLSLALVLAPSLQPGGDDLPIDKHDQSERHHKSDSLSSPVRGGSRSLLAKVPPAAPHSDFSVNPDFVSLVTRPFMRQSMDVVGDSNDDGNDVPDSVNSQSSMADHDYDESMYKHDNTWQDDFIIPLLVGEDESRRLGRKHNFSDSSGDSNSRSSVVVKVPRLE